MTDEQITFWLIIALAIIFIIAILSMVIGGVSDAIHGPLVLPTWEPPTRLTTSGTAIEPPIWETVVANDTETPIPSLTPTSALLPTTTQTAPATACDESSDYCTNGTEEPFPTCIAEGCDNP